MMIELTHAIQKGFNSALAVENSVSNAGAELLAQHILTNLPELKHGRLLLQLVERTLTQQLELTEDKKDHKLISTLTKLLIKAKSGDE